MERLVEIHKGRYGKVYITSEKRGNRTCYYLREWTSGKLVSVSGTKEFWDLDVVRRYAITKSGETYAAY
jgi:hypothetical protein